MESELEELVGKTGISLDHKGIVVRAGDVGSRELLRKLAQSFQPAFLFHIDKIHFRAVFPNGIDLYLWRRRGHDHSAPLMEERARERDRLPEVSRRGGDDMRLFYGGGYVVCSAKFEAASVLKRLAGQYQIDVEFSRESRCIDDGCWARSGYTRGRRPGGCRHGRPRGLRGLKNRRISAMNRNAIPAHRNALSSALIPHTSRIAAISISASLAIVNGVTVCPSFGW